MTDPRRGSAAVSLMWVIALAVIAIFAIAFGFMQMQQRTEAEDLARQAAAERDTARAELTPRIDSHVQLSQVVGYTPEAVGSTANVELIQVAVTEGAATFPSAKDAKTLQAVLVGAVTDFNAKLAESTSLANQSAQLRSELAAAQSQYQAALREKDGTIGQLRSELEDLRTTSNTQILDAERQRDALRDQVRESERQNSELRLQLAELERSKGAELDRMKQRNDILSERLNAVGRQAPQPDAAVLTVSAELGRAWMDRGRLDRIRPGMQFEVRSRTSGRSKGRVQVISTDDRRSEVDVLVQTDPYDPVSPDDFLFNDLYDPARTPVAILLGNGFGKLSNDDMRNLLREVGIRVDSEVTREADYLILGTPFFDPDTGELVPWTSQDAYKAAESLSVQVVPFRDAMAWLGI